ncbi:antitoxin Xre/MbcA/ParS toxin-binding domain-containing protein [Spirosoma foliorum]|nr:MbcA/ParS/Xre antitoxin family protein [Spirosoma foliorum]
MMKRVASPENLLLRDVPGHINDSEILSFLYTREVNWQHVNAIKTLTDFNDTIISDWLNVSVKTFREYKKPPTTFKENVKEQVLLLLALIKHGIAVFGSVKEFDQWLNRSNFYFDNKSPNAYLNTVTGLRFVDDRLTAMEYGDNV